MTRLTTPKSIPTGMNKIFREPLSIGIIGIVGHAAGQSLQLQVTPSGGHGSLQFSNDALRADIFLGRSPPDELFVNVKFKVKGAGDVG